MPYGRSYRFRRYRFNRRRTYNSRKLSSKNIYMNRGAKSQAVQIAALRNKINKVYKAAKPETKVIIDSTVADITLRSDALGNTQFGSGVVNISVGAADNQRVGDKILRKDYWYLTFEYFNSSNTGYHDNESAGTPLRVVCGGWKTNQNAYDMVPTAATIIANYSASGASSTASVVAPLVNGVSAEQNIYADKSFTITAERSQRIMKFKTPWYTCRFDSAGYSNHAWLLVKAGGLHWNQNFTESVLVTVSRKTVFRDA